MAHLCLGVGESCCLGIRLGGFSGLIGKELSQRMLWIMFIS